MPKKAQKKVESISHKDKRSNIPTEELRDFVKEDEQAPEVLLYPRDSSLDPQLVWTGKDKQDKEGLEVPVVPIYIQEKIHPQAIIAALPHVEAEDDQPNLFDDFNGGPTDFEQKVEFYQHEQNWSNRLILGDSLLVMTSLSEKEGLKGKVQTIYFDPPYGIKFGSNWQVSTRKRDVKDGRAGDATREPEQVRAYRDTWKLGIHSYLAYLRDRLVAAYDLLTETGSVFVQIGYENVHLVRCLMDEVFGSDNSVSLISFVTTSGFAANTLARSGDYILWYAKDYSVMKYRQLFLEKETSADSSQYRWLMFPDGTFRGMTSREMRGEDVLPSGVRLYRPDNLVSQGASSEVQVFKYKGKEYSPPPGSHFKTTVEGLKRLAEDGRIHVARNSIQYVRYADDFPMKPITNIWTDTATGNFTDDKVYVVQTASKVIARCILMTTDPGDLVLDPTCGSGTTAVAAEQWGRRWITCDTSRVALALARTRIMAAKFPFYLLSDSPEGLSKERDLTAQAIPDVVTHSDIRKGFVYKRVPHITLKSIATNPELKKGMTREERDAAIARHADLEILYDEACMDSKHVRVSGPFSVESLSPHRVLSTADDDQDGLVSETEIQKQKDFVMTILENLEKAGVQNTRKKERLKFDRLQPFPGKWLQATGEYTEAGGKTRRVAVTRHPNPASNRQLKSGHLR